MVKQIEVSGRILGTLKPEVFRFDYVGEGVTRKIVASRTQDDQHVTHITPTIMKLVGETNGDPYRSLDDLFALSNIELSLMPAEKHINAMRDVAPELFEGNEYPLWSLALPRAEYLKYVKGLLNQLIEALSGGANMPALSDDYYFSIFSPGSDFLSELRPATVNVERVKEIINDDPDSSAIMSTFLPLYGSDTLPPVEYDRFKTRTGRLTVKHGPDILRMPKKYRGVLKSSFPGGKVMMLDYVAFEPRLAAALAGKRLSGDIYASIAKNVLHDAVSRDVAKIMTLATLYGAAAATVANLSNVENAYAHIEKIRQFFDVYKLSSMYAPPPGSDIIKNPYGRMLRLPDSSKHLVLNTIVQSTAVDTALLNFRHFVRDCWQKEINIIPLYVVHDALIFDAPPEALEQLSSIIDIAEMPALTTNTYLSLHMQQKFLDIKFDVKCEQIQEC